MTSKEAIKRIKDFGLYHAISDLPNSALTVEAFEKAIELLRLEDDGLLVKLPFKIGDKLYYIQESSRITNNIKYILEVEVIHIRYDDNKFSFDLAGNVPCKMCMECFDEKGFGDYYNEHEEHQKNGYCPYEFYSRNIENINKNIFLTRKDAEDKLKSNQI